MPQPWRSVVDWVVTIVLAVVFVLAFEAEVAKPYRIPSSSMEPTLHCAKPGAWCEGSYNDRVIANRLAFRFSDPKRGQIVVFKTPPKAAQCGAGDGGATFVKRLIGLPGDRVSERDGQVYINGKKLERALRRPGAPRRRDRLMAAGRAEPLLLPRRRPNALVRLANVGNGSALEPDRPGDRDLLAAEPHRLVRLVSSRWRASGSARGPRSSSVARRCGAR